VERFHCTSRIENLRCLIKLVYYDHVWREQETAKAFQELDSYCGGDGETLEKVEREKAGEEVSIRDGKCLVRGKPTDIITDARDRTYISIWCKSCDALQSLELSTRDSHGHLGGGDDMPARFLVPELSQG